MLGIEQRARLAPYAVAVPVELHGGDPFDGFAAAGFADPLRFAVSIILWSISSRSTSMGTPAVMTADPMAERDEQAEAITA